MNNPDERTAVDQFGKGDKYFGVCTMMATMPGLPMFGHGQIEGFTEKYGMEYRRAYWDEAIDQDLVRRHEREVFPLLRRRYLFAPVENFLLYDFNTAEDSINEDVFAYSNRVGDESALVVFHNKFATAHGWIRNSTAYLVKTGPDPEDQSLARRSLGEALALHNESGYYTIFRDQVANLELIRSSQELHQQGLYIELGAYHCHVFTDFREVQETPGAQYGKLSAYLQGGAVSDVEEALKEFSLQPLHAPFRELINAGMLRWLIDHRQAQAAETRYGVSLKQALDEVAEKTDLLLKEIVRFGDYSAETQGITKLIREYVLSALELVALQERLGDKTRRELATTYQSISRYLQNGPEGNLSLETGSAKVWAVMLAWAVLSNLGRVAGEEMYTEQSRAWMDEWFFGKLTNEALGELMPAGETAERQLHLLRVLVSQSDWFVVCDQENAAYQMLSEWLVDADVQRYLLVHRHQDILWFNKESFKSFLWWMFSLAAIAANRQFKQAGPKPPVSNVTTEPGQLSNFTDQPRVDLDACFQFVQTLLQAVEKSDYQVEKLLEAAKAG